MTSAYVLEMVQFKLQAGVEREAFVEAAAFSDQKVRQMPGYRRRELLETGDGQWVDMVWWNTLDHAHAAMEAFNTDPELATFGSMIDPESIQMHHLNPVPLEAIR